MNVGTFLVQASTIHAHRIALEFRDERLDYGTLNLRVNRLANGLTGLGLRKGDRVAILQNNSPRLIETLFSCFKVGLAAVPMNARLHSEEFRYIIADSEARSVIYGEEFANAFGTVRKDISCVEFPICTSEEAPQAISYEGVVTNGSENEPGIRLETGDLAWLFYTSGTTGRPKGAMLSHRNLISMSMNFLADIYSASHRDLALHAAPLTHGSGLYALPLIARGARNIILPGRFDPKLLLETVERTKVTLIPFLAPTMIKMLLSTPGMRKYDLSSLKCIVYGGSSMYLEDLRAALRRFGSILVQIYGQGEAPMTISYLGMEDHLSEADEKRELASAGIPRTDVEMKILEENDREVPAGQMGEICVRGDVVMEGYWRNPGATEETMRGGWLHTGDLGYVDGRGYLYIMDRKKDMIIRGGSNIYPREVEEVILRHPSVHEVAVVGIPDLLWGETVKAFVVLKNGHRATEEEIVEFCKQHMASYKKPQAIEFLDSLPKNAYGKVLKKDLIRR